MKRTDRMWSLVSILAAPAGLLLEKSGWFAPNPGTYFALGFLAAVCLGGIVLGTRPLWQATRTS